MMWWSRRVRKDDIRADQKWDFISLNDFKSSSCFTPFAYGYLILSLVISVAVYAVDIFTAVNLLAFNRWSGNIKPIISFDISKWIFSACIIASLVNLAYEHLRAWHVMRRGAVSESYLDPLAVRLECVRMGKQGRGWRRFLVFAELTKSKKGAEIVALFTYFSFQTWIRVIVCQGPQKVINALTLWSVFKANLDPSGAKNVGEGFLDFFKKIGILASQDDRQAVILSGMLFTLVIWVLSALSLIIAVLFYIFFLWHYIPNSDGGLLPYCERKINTRLAEIVSVKVNKALEEEERKLQKADQKALRNGEKPAFNRQATLPTLLDAKDDKLPEMPMLHRDDTAPTLPLYTSRPGTPGSALPAFEMDDFDKKPSYAFRAGTGNSYKPSASLLGNASDMGYGRTSPPNPSLPPLNTNGMPLAPQQAMTNSSASSNPWNGNFPPGPSQSRGPQRMPSAMGDRGYTQSPVSYSDNRSLPSPPPLVDSYGRPIPSRSNTPIGPTRQPRLPFDPYAPSARSSPAPQPPSDYGRSSPAPGLSISRSPPPTDNYVAYDPRPPPSASSSYARGFGPPPRSMTDPTVRPPPSDYFSSGPQSSATGMGNNPMNGRGVPDRLRVREGPARLASPAPYVNNSYGRVSPHEHNPGGATFSGPPPDPYNR